MVALLHVICTTVNLNVIRAFVDEYIKEYLSNKDAGLVTMAVDEVCSNLMEHGGCHNIWLELDNENDGVIIKICDDGSAFDMNAYKPRTLQELVAGHHTGGLGLRLVQNVMDSIVYKTLGSNNECHMYKKRTRVLA